MKTLRSSVLLLGIGLWTAAQVQAAEVSWSAEIHLGHAPPPPPPDVVIIDPVGPPGPPPWAPGHWFRRNRTYYYYPESDVYYRPADRAWFYLEGDAWRVGVVLPDRFRVDFDHCVPLSMETDRPYLHHREVVRYYPPQYFARVRFKERRDHHGWDRHEDHEQHHDRDHQDHDSDRGPHRRHDRGRH